MDEYSGTTFILFYILAVLLAVLFLIYFADPAEAIALV